MPNAYDLYQKTTRLPGGKHLFSVGYSLMAPYFATVLPRVREVRPNHAELLLPKWKGVENHLGTVHAIAVCNGLEAAMGLVAEATVPRAKRWIPNGMQVEYLAKSDSSLVCTADTDPADWEGTGDLPVRVQATRKDGTVVVRGVITLYVSEKPQR